MRIHTYREESFGYLIAFRDGYIGLYTREAGSLCAANADSDTLAPYKLKQFSTTRDFHLRSPLLVWLELTRRCNLRCRHCFAPSAERFDGNELSGEQLCQLLEGLRARGVICVVFSGGEPLLRPDTFDLLGHAHQLGFVISLVTNGLLLTESAIARIPRPGIRVTLSLDNLHLGEIGSNTQKKRLEYLKDRLLLLKGRGIACNVSSTMTRENLGLLQQIFSWLVAHDIPFRTIPFTPIGRGASFSHLQMTPSEIKPAAELWAMELIHERRLHGTTGLTFSDVFDYALTLVYMTRACKGARSIAYICADGEVFPCTTCAGASMFHAGNIKEVPFDYIWEQSLREFRRLTSWDNFPDCAGCRLSSSDYFCTNRCPPLSLLYRGVPNACGATQYDRGSLARRTKLLPKLLDVKDHDADGT